MGFGRISRKAFNRGVPPAQRVPRGVKAYVAKAIDRNIENKHLGDSLDNTFDSLPNTWTELNVCNPAQGDTAQSRTGRQIKIKSIEIRGVIVQASVESALDEPYNTVRVVLGLYNTSDTPLADSGTTIDGFVTTNLSTRAYLIKKYLDKYIAMGVSSTEKGGGDGYAPTVRTFKYFKRFKKPIVVMYGDDTTDYPNKRLILSMVSDSSVVPNPGFYHGYYLCTFEDA